MREPVRIIKRTWKTALKNAGIRHVRFHDLRSRSSSCSAPGTCGDERRSPLGPGILARQRQISLYLALEHIAQKCTRPVQNWEAALQRFAILLVARCRVQ